MKKGLLILVVGVIAGVAVGVSAMHCPKMKTLCHRIVNSTMSFVDSARCSSGCSTCSDSVQCQLTCPKGEKQMSNEQAQAMEKLKAYTHDDFYKEGQFDQQAAKEAYYTLMQAHNFPIYPILKTDAFWVSDFAQNEFEKVGMGGNFWMNLNYEHADKTKSGFLSHEIYLLPGQMIIEHTHKAVEGIPAKREAWMVRHGSVYAFSCEDEPKAEACPVQPSANQVKKGYVTCNSWKEVKPGEWAEMNGALKFHFLIAGPEGAIVTETGTYHADASFHGEDVKF